jgi:hypothetical protein
MIICQFLRSTFIFASASRRDRLRFALDDGQGPSSSLGSSRTVPCCPRTRCRALISLQPKF